MIIPAILTNNKTDLINKLSVLEKIGMIKWAQIDIMDNKFVPYRSVGVDELQDIKTTLSLEAHLMVLNPETYYQKLQSSAFKRVIFHIESTPNTIQNIEIAKEYGLEVGVALNPETSFSTLESIINLIDLVLFLGVRPGQQGQVFIENVLEKINNVRSIYPELVISLDGGISKDNIAKIFKSGVDHMVVGSAIWKNNKPLENYQELQNML